MKKIVRLTAWSSLCLLGLGIVGCSHTNATSSGSGAGGAISSTSTGSVAGDDMNNSSVPPINLDQE